MFDNESRNKCITIGEKDHVRIQLLCDAYTFEYIIHNIKSIPLFNQNHISYYKECDCRGDFHIILPLSNEYEIIEKIINKDGYPSNLNFIIGEQKRVKYDKYNIAHWL